MYEPIDEPPARFGWALDVEHEAECCGEFRAFPVDLDPDGVWLRCPTCRQRTFVDLAAMGRDPGADISLSFRVARG